MRQDISLLQFLTSLIIGIYALITVTHFTVTTFNVIQFIYMTTWNYYISTIYLIILSICDFSLYILKSNKLDKLNEIFREILSPAFTALTYLVSLTFWITIFPGIVEEGGDETHGMSLYINIYVHSLLTLFQTIDIFISYRKNKGIVIKYDLLIAFFIVGAYSVLSLILIYGFNIAVYPFFDKMTWYKAIGLFILFLVVIFITYLIHVGLIKLKYKCKIFILKNENVGEILVHDDEANKENRESN